MGPAPALALLTLSSVVDGLLAHSGQALAALDMLEGDLIGQQRATARPRPHTYELSPAQ